MREFNILIGSENMELPRDKELFFGPLLESDSFYHFKVEDTLPFVLRQLGIFTSITDAIKNGWNKPILEGYTEFKIGSGKNLRRFYVYKRSTIWVDRESKE